MVGIGPDDLSAFFNIHLDMASVIGHPRGHILLGGVVFPIGSENRGARLAFELRVNRTGCRLLSTTSATASTAASSSTGASAHPAARSLILGGALQKTDAFIKGDLGNLSVLGQPGAEVFIGIRTRRSLCLFYLLMKEKIPDIARTDIPEKCHLL